MYFEVSLVGIQQDLLDRFYIVFFVITDGRTSNLTYIIHYPYQVSTELNSRGPDFIYSLVT